MRLAQRHVVAAATVLAGLTMAGHAGAQEPSGKVMMPWQKPQPQSRPAPDMREILPWLMGEEAAAKSQPGDASAWAAKLDDPVGPAEPFVEEPMLAAPRLETGAIAPSGLVLKKPIAAVHAVAAQPGATKTEPVAKADDQGRLPPATTRQAQAADIEPAAQAVAEGAKSTKPGDVAGVGSAAPETAPAAVSAPDAQRQGDGSATSAVDAAASLPEAEDVPGIPEPLPDAVVTPVRQPEPAKPEATASPAHAAATDAPERLPAVKPNPPRRLPDGANAAQQYCFNIADAAKDARYAWQKKTLADVEAELNKRIALLDERTAEYQKWLARRDEFIRTAEEGVVKIYSGMKPDTAAGQLALMHEETAAAVLVKLNTRNASAILNEMEPARAARLTSIITGAAKLKRKKQRDQEAAAAPAGVNGAAGDTASDPPAPPATEGGGRS
jgi:flagellar motility protein MotE (MotC chaperone)